MPEIDLGAYRADQGFYLVGSRTGARFEQGPAEPGGYAHRFSYRGSATTIADAAVDLVRGARGKIFLASYRIGDGPLLEALYEAVDRLRGGVYVITSWDEKALRKDLPDLAPEETAHEVKAQLKRFDEMTRRGITVRGHPSCHAKFLVVDDRAALVSSANLETSALRGTADRAVTGESGTLLTDAGEAQLLGRFFTRMWFAGCTGEARPGDKYALKDRGVEPSPCDVPVPPVGPRAGVIWTHEDEHGILETINDIVDRSRDELLLASYSLVGLAEQPRRLLDAIARACARGVRVSLLVRGRNLPRDLRDARMLTELGVRLFPDSLTHAKGALADGRTGALFSANFDFDHGLINGVEMGVRLDGTPALADAHRYLRHAMRNADMEYAARPSQRELAAGYPARWRKAWPLPAAVPITTDPSTWARFAAAAAHPPVLFEAQGDEVALVTARDRWLLERAGNRWRLAGQQSADDPLSLLGRWSRAGGRRTGTEERPTTRGFADATFSLGD
ncbi:phosphatidylserine/phosphatidylglycerophosphate/cardiolipin synthase family protein [Actinoplanes oblitus]|uniref:phospholipase D n=1 Tax=Actinoplanes oblitus TaxID=3040509 RepID=A0ABY8WSV7_9ACTN|nr:phosphatidylserine/phosphatidylglycerophosphate/cardiolipin synthase family protein [Actinoplanes oblitus]WIM99658.1 phosphatidylserine/phosphatidylglycerophosphate/cardiolipin synthase family protein [Actinoplanes oblitus]